MLNDVLALTSSNATIPSMTSSENFVTRKLVTTVDPSENEATFSPNRIEVSVIGAGIAGVCFAIEAAQRGHLVTLFEQKRELFDSSSRNNVARVHLGFHYADAETQLTCLRHAIKFARKYPNLLRGTEPDHPLPANHPIRRGRYFVLRDGDIDATAYSLLCAKMQREYERLIDEDPANKIYGDRLFERCEAPTDISCDLVDAAFDTAEHIVNLERFREYLIEKVQKLNINVHVAHELIDVNSDGNMFSLKFSTSQGIVEQRVPFVVNATWGNVQHLSQKAGHLMATSTDADRLVRERTNRLKAIATVRLPESLRDVSHMMFVISPNGCSLTNNGDGTALITYEPVTNITALSCLRLNRQAVVDDVTRCTIRDLRLATPMKDGSLRLPDREAFVTVRRTHRVLISSHEHLLVSKILVSDLRSARMYPRERNTIRLVYREAKKESDRIWNIAKLFLDEEIVVEKSASVDDVLAGRLSTQSRKEIGERIRRGVERYVPAVRDAEVVDTIFGIVQTAGKYEPFDKNGSHHQRTQSGVEELQVGWVNLLGVKLLMAPFDAELAVRLVERQAELNDAIGRLEFSADETLNRTIRMIVRHRMISTERRGVEREKLEVGGGASGEATFGLWKSTLAVVRKTVQLYQKVRDELNSIRRAD